MRDDLRCDCHICEVERHLFVSLTEPPGNIRLLLLAASSPLLTKFTNISELLAYLHSPRTGDYASSNVGELLTALIRTEATVPDSEVIHSVLVLVFAPTIHRTYREVSAWFRELEPEDIASRFLRSFWNSSLPPRSKTSSLCYQSPLPEACARTHSAGQRRRNVPCISARTRCRQARKMRKELLKARSKQSLF